MKTINTVSVPVTRLKSELSRYLRQVEEGSEIVVTSFSHPVAKVVPYTGTADLAVKPATRPVSDLARFKGVRVRLSRDPVALLREDRDRR